MRKTDRVFEAGLLKGQLLDQVKAAWRKAADTMPDFFETVEEKERRDNEERISGSLDRVNGQLKSCPHFIWQMPGRKKWKRDTERMIKDILRTEPLLNMEKAMSGESLECFWKETKSFLRTVRKFDHNMQIEDMGQALRNYLVYAIFLELNGMEQNCKPSIFGYSMLYPYTDNYIDDPEVTAEEKKHYNQLIADKLRGTDFEALSLHERKTAELLSGIERDYIRPDEIYAGLTYMLEAQKSSQKQPDSRETLSEEEVLDISVYKGGLSVLIDRYFIDKDFSERDLYFYYGFGFMLQLCDDLQDITQDGQEGSRTVFTICRQKEEIVRKVNKLLHFTRELFEKCDSDRREFKEFLLRNCYLLILFSAEGSREHMTEEWLAWEENKLPVGGAFAEKIKREFSGTDGEEGKARFDKMLDLLVSE